MKINKETLAQLLGEAVAWREDIDQQIGFKTESAYLLAAKDLLTKVRNSPHEDIEILL